MGIKFHIYKTDGNHDIDELTNLIEHRLEDFQYHEVNQNHFRGFLFLLHIIIVGQQRAEKPIKNVTMPVKIPVKRPPGIPDGLFQLFACKRS